MTGMQTTNVNAQAYVRTKLIEARHLPTTLPTNLIAEEDDELKPTMPNRNVRFGSLMRSASVSLRAPAYRCTDS